MLELNPFTSDCAAQIAAFTGLNSDVFLVSLPPKPEMGDYAVGCFPAAKQLKTSPVKVASDFVAQFTPTKLIESASNAGPFVNFKLNRNALLQWVLAEGSKSITAKPGEGKTICIDYSSPNISKQLAYHHIRSTVIGQALVNLHRALGYRVVAINHLGDWGTTHGMLLAAVELWGMPEPLNIETLNETYVKFRAAIKEDASLEETARQWFKRLEDGESEARATWQNFKDISWAEFARAYDMLGVKFDEVKGESEYVSDVDAVLSMLDQKGLTEISEGALVVPAEKENEPPLLLKKKDGATLYGTRDLAAAIYRHKTYGFDKNLYVVDRGQGLHFKQVFRALTRAGLSWAEGCKHVSFGLIRLGGKKTATRNAGKQKAILLMDVFSEATQRSAKRIAESNPDMPADKLEETAKQV